jgi:large conductance mechanosensitive channel
LLAEFKQFLFRGNIVDLAVAVVLGTAFAALITQLTKSFLQPLINIITGGGVKGGKWIVDGQVFDYGAFINALITFLVIAAVIFFLVVKPVNALMARRKTEPPVDEQTRPCPECLSEIPVLARRCAFCTAEVGAA